MPSTTHTIIPCQGLKDTKNIQILSSNKAPQSQLSSRTPAPTSHSPHAYSSQPSTTSSSLPEPLSNDTQTLDAATHFFAKPILPHCVADPPATRCRAGFNSVVPSPDLSFLSSCFGACQGAFASAGGAPMSCNPRPGDEKGKGKGRGARNPCVSRCCTQRLHTSCWGGIPCAEGSPKLRYTVRELASRGHGMRLGTGKFQLHEKGRSVGWRDAVVR